MKLSITIEKANSALKKVNIEHALIGGIALSCLGLNRATSDVDLIIDGEKKELAKKALKEEGFILKLETKEVIHFSGLGFLDILLANRPLSKEMLKNSSNKTKLGIKCLQAEDIIGLKIQAYKNNPKRELQDKADIKKLFEITKNINVEKIKKYADIFNEWDKIKILMEEK
jgi:hypothetical protein